MPGLPQRDQSLYRVGCVIRKPCGKRAKRRDPVRGRPTAYCYHCRQRSRLQLIFVEQLADLRLRLAMRQAPCDASGGLAREAAPEIVARPWQVQCEKTELCKIPGRAGVIRISFQGIATMRDGLVELPVLGGDLPQQKVELAPILYRHDRGRMQ